MAFIEPIPFTLKDGRAAVVRASAPADAAELIALVNENLRDGAGMVLLPGEFKPTADEERAWIEDGRTRAGSLMLVAECGGVLIGELMFKTGVRQALAHGGHFGMSVHPRWRGLGAGEALLGALLAW